MTCAMFNLLAKLMSTKLPPLPFWLCAYAMSWIFGADVPRPIPTIAGVGMKMLNDHVCRYVLSIILLYTLTFSGFIASPSLAAGLLYND
eukprot:12096906-Karenia_brevis.AAC.1